MSDIFCVYALYPGADAAKASARIAVEECLAACANILAPCTSIYEWEGDLREESEVPVLFKTSARRRDALIARLAQLHPYDTPAIVAWSVDEAHVPFANWVNEQTS
ncbi:MAG: divalent-cation tolerance protein CutA [Sphingobium sp.]